MSPGQLRLFCKPATISQLNHFKYLGWEEAAMSPTQPLGINTLMKLFKKGDVMLGLKDPERFT